MTDPAPVLLWFKRDLRLHDHPALSRAAGLGPILPVYIVEPAYWRLPEVSGRQWAFTQECVADLARALAARGVPLVVETGLPFVDACMRALIATGWLNFRARAMLVAAASYHLWLDWRTSGAVLARYFTDYEPGIHWPQVQMQSGTTGMNTVRIYNPVKQGYDNDPTGAFTRRWLPELADVPDRFLQEPWRWEGAGTVLDRTYPAPIVDPKAAAAAAREKVWAVRRGDAFHAEAARVVDRHASRKDPKGRFVSDRAPRNPWRGGNKSAPDQLSFDL